MRNSKYTSIVFAALILLVTYVALFGFRNDILGITVKGAPDMRFGIDIRGGVDVAFSPRGLDRPPTAQELDSAKAVVERRLDQRNILDREVTVDYAGGYVFARFPWRSGQTDFNPEEAIEELGKMSELSFRDPDGAVVITGRHVSSVGAVGVDNSGTSLAYYVPLTLNAEGAALFAEATGRLVGQKLSIYMDYNEDNPAASLISDPTVQTQISDGECIITGQRTRDEAQRLANEIAAGALPFAMESKNYSTISPTLGSNALEVMLIAGALSFALVCLYMLVYYRLNGVVAVFSLALQIAGTILVLSIPQLTVTLPGIAAIILSVGMGVDANVIISERIREELKSGKALDAALQAGFKRAFSAVFDGNITMMIVAVVMLLFGSGTLLSFAYTLLFGIIMNFAAGVYVTRTMTFSVTRIPALRKTVCFMSDKYFKKEQKVWDFAGKKKIIYPIAGAVALAVLVFALLPGFGVTLDIEFKGGAQVRYELTGTVDVEDARSVVAGVVPGAVVNARETQDIASGRHSLVLEFAGGQEMTTEDFERIGAALRAAFSGEAFPVVDSNNVSPYFGELFLRKAIYAILISCALIVLYVWFSFRRIHGLSAGVIALLALLHDAVLVFLTFLVFRIPIGDSYVAATLTILGYSINATIINYDRIRENMFLDSSLDPEVICNRSISQCLTRNINTSLAPIATLALLFVFAAANGLESIRTFALPLAVGLLSGFYSSTFIVGPSWVLWERRKARKAKAKKLHG
ncbi:MAG: protein translocase subunit SecD [Oscillospiraceae bacterium]|nr:protein translocase subunit SecD [Oscillospiraceae bacterium]